MNYTGSHNYLISSDGVNRIAYYVYLPVSGDPSAVVQISHSMWENTELYEPFIDYLCGCGFAVVSNDHLGHGGSAKDRDHLGYFSLDKGWINLLHDLHRVMLLSRLRFRDIPHYFIGNSMGALIVRGVLAKYSEDTDGAILIDSPVKNPLTDSGIVMANAEIMLNGVRSRSKRLTALFNSLMGGNRSGGSDFIYTCSAYRDWLMLWEYCSDYDWFDKVRSDLPLMLMNGKNSEKLFGTFIRRGFTDVDIKIKDSLTDQNSRHDSYEEITRWLNIQLKRREV
ncbi:MAG: alpha/beta hydrolase [Ruminococcus sp.]|nr:alpha/beta hydrolase [Ruminococcus sp.]